MNVRASLPGQGRSPEVEADIRRIGAIWRDCRERFGGSGAFLFGNLTLADIAFAPVVSRFRTYAVDLDAREREYADSIWSLPEMREWCSAAAAEPWTIERYGG